MPRSTASELQAPAMEPTTTIQTATIQTATAQTATAAAEPGPSDRLPSPEPLTSGGFAQELIQHQLRRLEKLQPQVIADTDPEALHQLRVSLRRLRTALLQFGPALVLPASLRERRLAAVARRTSLCRDLDVLGLRLKNELVPRLPREERRRLHGAIQGLERERGQALATLVEELRGARYRKLLQRFNGWLKRPQFTPLGQLPLLPWLVEWQAPFSSGLFLHAGWLELNPAAAALHGLRKRIKTARYSLEIVGHWCDPPLLAWIEDLKQAQDLLGELHDLQVLRQLLAKQLDTRKRPDLPVLQAELEAQQLRHWLDWRELAERLHSDRSRTAIGLRMLELGRSPPPCTPDRRSACSQ